MTTVASVLTLIVSAIHFYFLILEMFLWTKPKGMKTFGIKKDFAEQTKTLAANQGLYNGFIAAGLLWSGIDTNLNPYVRYFFLVCVILAGVFGSISLKNKKVFLFQSLPAIIALLVTLLYNS